MELALFHTLVAGHIVTGSTGALAFWVPILARKGGAEHKRWGRVFTFAMLATGCCAVLMALLTTFEPMATHPHLEGRFEPGFIRGIFGWMMLHMGVLTINLAWYGWLCIKNRRNHAANRTRLNLALQAAVILAAVNCAVQGWLIGQPLMMGISLVGVATGVTNLRFLLNPTPAPQAWLREHIKALVGAGISVYTAFLAFGSVRVIPELALHPVTWSIPLVTGISIILYQWRKLAKPPTRRTAAA
ncbi:hypothetical protein ACFQY5_12940 [Paeniroseomonas aquatica]|uniref:DUF2306 domain-containing protein n=1 Tax=Paeniroseomonas aquatica TaxID=373043 RepID=A0ABT8ACW6_9PROT|nr:hypothetical protein [Paeniroseomonas aquatica]MDN3567585.1 hypothetical protein [Paeniroseomonas aquatica]